MGLGLREPEVVVFPFELRTQGILYYIQTVVVPAEADELLGHGVHEVGANKGQGGQLVESFKNLAFLEGGIMGGGGEEGFGSLLDEGLFVEGVFGEDEGEVGEEDNFECDRDVFVHNY